MEPKLKAKTGQIEVDVKVQGSNLLTTKVDEANVNTQLMKL